MMATRGNRTSRLGRGLAIVLGLALAASLAAVGDAGPGRAEFQDRPVVTGRVPNPPAAADMFLKIPDIPGESTDDKHKGEIEVQSWSWGRGSAARKPTGGPGSITITKRVDKASPKLYEAANRGQRYPTVTLTVRKAGGGPGEYMEIKMENVLVSSYQRSRGSADIPSETLSLNFDKVQTRDLPPRRVTSRP